jgi:hypothetical protein
MKKRIGFALMAFVALCGITASANAVDCASMKITMISGDATAGANAWLRNDTGAACGAIAPGAEVYFIMNPAEVDKLLAVGLTAVSLGKNVWVRAEGDVNGSYLSILSIDNH